MLRWVKAGRLTSHMTGGGRHRILQSDLVSFMRGRGMPVPDVLDAGPPRIAVVEDDPLMRKLLVRIVQKARPDAQVQSAADGFAGGVLVAQMKPHLLLLDLVMAGLDGIEVCRRLRANPELSGVIVVVVSSHLDAGTRLTLSRLGVERFLVKPLDRERLDEVLRDCLGSGKAAT